MKRKKGEPYSKPIERIAMIGGRDFDGYALDKFLAALYEKYPRAVIVTGSGQGAERSIAIRAEQVGFTVEIPPVRPELYGSHAGMCQINDVMMGANVIVTVGSPNASRPKRAKEIWNRCDRDMNSWNCRPYFNTAQPIVTTTAKPKKRKATKRGQEFG